MRVRPRKIDACLLVDMKRIPGLNGGTAGRLCLTGRGKAIQLFTQAAPNELKLGKGEYDERRPMAMLLRRVFVGHRSGKQDLTVRTSCMHAETYTLFEYPLWKIL